jgi:cell wall-associated NlpC family hydrolase
MANGTKIHAGKLKPGDMVFYRSPEHVAIYIDNGQVIEFGGNPGPRIEPVNYRNDILGYYSFDLSGTPNKYIGKGPGPWAGAEIAH